MCVYVYNIFLNICVYVSIYWIVSNTVLNSYHTNYKNIICKGKMKKVYISVKWIYILILQWLSLTKIKIYLFLNRTNRYKNLHIKFFNDIINMWFDRQVLSKYKMLKEFYLCSSSEFSLCDKIILFHFLLLLVKLLLLSYYLIGLSFLFCKMYYGHYNYNVSLLQTVKLWLWYQASLKCLGACIEDESILFRDTHFFWLPSLTIHPLH